MFDGLVGFFQLSPPVMQVSPFFSFFYQAKEQSEFKMKILISEQKPWTFLKRIFYY